jgi:hypothetical protein
VRAYTAADEEALHILKLLKDWVNLGFLEESQRQTMQHDIPCELRRTNGFLRIVLFLFTLISAVASVALFFVIFFPGSDARIVGTFLLIFAAVCYAGAEFTVSRFRLYRHGIEEGLAVLSIGFLCAGLQAASKQDSLVFVVPAAGAIAAYLLYHRFGLQYLFLAAMACVAAIPQFWTASHSGQHLIVAAFYLAGLTIVNRIRPSHRFDYLDAEYSVIETLLWLGLYLSLNLQLSSLAMIAHWRPDLANATEFSRPFYWTTFALIWLLPAMVLWRSLAIKDRTITSLGLAVAILTLATNKPYLGLPHHAWDPILLGILLTGAALAVRRWLANGPAGIRRGFTAQRLSARDKQWVNSLSPSLAIVLPNPATLAPIGSEHKFGGGTSGGGGASSDF